MVSTSKCFKMTPYAIKISNENFYLIYISSGGNLHMKNMTTLLFFSSILHLTAAFTLICDLQQLLSGTTF
jgi:hypothetical protein